MIIIVDIETRGLDGILSLWKDYFKTLNRVKEIEDRWKQGWRPDNV